MLIIWGSREFKKELGIMPQQYECGHCHNTSNYSIYRTWRWFTLYWIPIFPISFRHYYVTCPICNYGKEITKEEAEKYLQKEVYTVG